jgi:hypothetical protein
MSGPSFSSTFRYKPHLHLEDDCFVLLFSLLQASVLK